MAADNAAYNIDAFQRTVLASFLPSGRLVAAAPSEDVINALNAAASAASASAADGERRVLLAIPPGEGRSPLVANWVAQRIQGAANGKGAPRECVAYHFATCSAASADSRVLLHRLVRRLEAYVDAAVPSPAAALDVAFDEAALLERFEAVAKRAATLAPLVIAVDAADAVSQSADASGSPRPAMDWLVGPRGLAARLPARACLVASVTMATPLSAAEQVAAGGADALDAALVGETNVLAAVAQVVSATPTWTLVAPGRAPSQSERQRAVSAFMDFKSGADEVDAALAAVKGAALGAAAAMEGQPAVRTFLRAVECFASATAEGALAEGVDALAPKLVCATLEEGARAAAKRASVEQHTRCRAVTGALVEAVVALWEGAGTNKTGQHRRGPVGFVAQQLRGILLCLATARDGLLFGEMMDVVRDSASGEAEEGGEASLSPSATEATWRERAEEARRRNRIASKPVVWRAVLEAMQAVGVLRVGDLLVVPRDVDASPLRVWAAAQPAAAHADAAATLVAFFVARRESAAASVAPSKLAPDGGASFAAELIARSTIPPQVAELVAAVERSTAPAPEDERAPAIVGSAAAAIPAPAVAAARAALAQASVWRAAAELPWLLEAAGDWATLRGVVAHPLTVLSLWTWGEAWEAAARSAGASVETCEVAMPTLTTPGESEGAAEAGAASATGEVDSLLSAVLAAESTGAMGQWTCRPDRLMQRGAILRWWRSLAAGLEEPPSAAATLTGAEALAKQRRVDPVEELGRAALEWATLSVPAPSSCQIHDAVVATWHMLAGLAAFESSEVTPTLHAELKLHPLERFGICAAAEGDATQLTALDMVRAAPPSIASDVGKVFGVSGAAYARRWRWVMWPWLALRVHLNASAAPMMRRLREECAYETRAAEAGVESTARIWSVRKSNIFAEGELTATAGGAARGGELSGVPAHLRDLSVTTPSGGLLKHMMSATLNASISKRRPEEWEEHGDEVGADGIEAGPALRGSEQDVAHEIFKRRKRAAMRASPARKQQGGSAAAPFSSPSRRSLKHGTRFPSVEMHAREAGERLFPIFQHGTQEATAATASVIPMPASISSKHLANLPAHLQGHPLNRVEADAARARERLHRLRKKFDALVHEEDVKTRKQRELEQAVLDRQTEDNFTAREMQAGERKMKLLHERVLALAAAVAEADATRQYYGHIIAHCDVNPPKDDKHIVAIERAADGANAALETALAQREAAEYELNHLSAQEMPALEAALARNRELRADVIDRLNQAKLRLQSEQEDLGAKQLRRHEIVTDVNVVHSGGLQNVPLPLQVDDALERLERNSNITRRKMREAALERTRGAGAPVATAEEMNAAWARVQQCCRATPLPDALGGAAPSHADFLAFYRKRDELAMQERMDRASRRLRHSEILSRKRELQQNLRLLEVRPPSASEERPRRDGSPPPRDAGTRRAREIATIAEQCEQDRRVLVEATGLIVRIAKICDVPLSSGAAAAALSSGGSGGGAAARGDDSLLRVAEHIPLILERCRAKLAAPAPLKLAKAFNASASSRAGSAASSPGARSSRSRSRSPSKASRLAESPLHQRASPSPARSGSSARRK